VNPIGGVLRFVSWIIGLLFPSVSLPARLTRRILGYFKRKGEFHIDYLEAFLKAEPGSSDILSPIDGVAALVFRQHELLEANPDANERFPSEEWLRRNRDAFYSQVGQVSWDLSTMGYPGLSDDLLRTVLHIASEHSDTHTASSIRAELERRQTNSIRRNPFIMLPME
jgi:hypothetical protein